MSDAPAVMLIEDDRDYVDVVVRALGKANVAVALRVVSDGQEALDVLGLSDDGGRPWAPLPRVMFLDLKMPRVDGWEVLRRVRAARNTAHLPVVVVSASDRPEDMVRSYALGANSYLLKRFDPRGPGANLAEAVRYWVEMNRVPIEWESRSWRIPRP